MELRPVYKLNPLRKTANASLLQIETTDILLTERYNTVEENISYARRLQTHLSGISTVLNEESLKDHFILDLPKDIVSGDFGWYRKAGDKLIAVVGDSTGHGVSGAMISVLINGFLDRYVAENNDITPSAILKSLHKFLVPLNQPERSSFHTGADIAVCCIDPHKREIRFSGANRPLYLVRSGILFILSGSRIRMGFHRDENPDFCEEVMPYYENDRVYMFTDGYCDQFGGTFNKKILTKKLRGLLLNSSLISMRKQKDQLEKFFHLWKSGMEQTDDVYVMGIRL